MEEEIRLFRTCFMFVDCSIPVVKGGSHCCAIGVPCGLMAWPDCAAAAVSTWTNSIDAELMQ